MRHLPLLTLVLIVLGVILAAIEYVRWSRHGIRKRAPKGRKEIEEWGRRASRRNRFITFYVLLIFVSCLFPSGCG